MNGKKRVIKQDFVVVISELNQYLEHKRHVMTIQLHKKRKNDLIDDLIGWFEKDFDETIKYAKGHKVKHCLKCNKTYVFEHNSCLKIGEITT